MGSVTSRARVSPANISAVPAGGSPSDETTCLDEEGPQRCTRCCCGCCGPHLRRTVCIKCNIASCCGCFVFVQVFVIVLSGFLLADGMFHNFNKEGPRGCLKDNQFHDWKCVISEGTAEIIFPWGTFNHSKWTFVQQSDVAEEVYFPARADGVQIAASWLKKPGSSKVVMVVHGHQTCRWDEKQLAIANFLWRANFSVLAIDLRNHGLSGFNVNKVVTHGPKEYLDILGAWDWLVENQSWPISSIGVYGVSMGGASAAFAIGKEPRLQSTWIESPLCDPYEEMTHVLGYTIPAFSYMQGAARWIGYQWGNSWEDTVDLLAEWPYEMLERLQGNQSLYMSAPRGDLYIPIESAGVQRCWESASRSPNAALTGLWIVDDSIPEDYDWPASDGVAYYHGMTFFLDPERFACRVVAWFNLTLGHTLPLGSPAGQVEMLCP